MPWRLIFAKGDIIMKICGLQKLTLLDYPDKTACTVFTDSCNFRCPFCHNASLVFGRVDEKVSEAEFFDFLSMRRGVLSGVAITGGEPTLHSDLGDFIREIHEMGFSVKLDTNGYLPGVLEKILDTGNVDFVAMDVKSSPDCYAAAVGMDDVKIENIEKSIDIIKNSGIDFEFRTTAVKGLHSPKDFLEIGRWIGNVPRYFIQKFVDSGDLIGKGYSSFSDGEMMTLLAMARVGSPCAALRGV